MRHNEEIEQIKNEVRELQRQFGYLSEALVASQTISKSGFAGKVFFHPENFIGDINTKLLMILDHLKLKFQWVDCKPHYELKEKEDK